MMTTMQLCLLLVFAVCEISSNPQVRIKQGVLRGQYLKTVKERVFSAFTAIPYAEPPIGDLRFKVAQPAGHWNGVLNASKPHAVCPQSAIIFGDPTTSGDEDCLYLNVYTPQIKFPGTKLYPVMIFIHGGSFFAGNANRDLYDPSMLLDKDVVLVVPNYRLGPLGFLSTGDEVVPGNNGLKDQNLAIKWTKRNIRHFGGNPESVTIFGQSAGGASAHFHMLSPLSRGLIKGVISQSGTAFSNWAVALNNEGLRNSRRLAQSFNCTINSSHAMVECLRQVDAIEMIKIQDTFYSVTIFGQSAGGASAHFHMLSPLSRGLIKGVISQSGTAFSNWAVALNNEGLRNSRRLAQSFNCTINSSHAMVECLRQVDAIEMIKIQDTFYVWHVDPLIPFKPVIEHNIEGAFLPQHPRDIIKSGKAAKVPFITGINTEDGAIKSSGVFGNQILLQGLSDDFDRLVPLSLLYYETAPDTDFVTKQIKEFYFDNRKIDNSSRTEVTNMYTDGYFLTSVNDAVRLHIKYTNQPVYYYAFGYRGTLSLSPLYGDRFYNYGVCHGDELLYLFSLKSIFPNYAPSEADKKIMEILTTLWTNFAITGHPTPRINSVIPKTWNAVQTKNLEYYSIKNYSDINMAANLYFERTEFWKHLPIK